MTMPGAEGRRRIVVLGAGFGGLRLAVALGRKLAGRSDAEVLLIDRSAYHTLKPKLPQAVGGRIPCAVQAPIERVLEGLPVRFLQAEVGEIDPRKRVVKTSEGDLTYWRLVIALGSEARLPVNVAGADDGLPAWTFDQCCAIRRRLEFLLGKADRLPPEALNVAVLGAGFVGSELAGEIADKMRRQRVDPNGRVHLIEQAERILPGLPANAARRVRAMLEEAGVAIHTGRRAERIEMKGPVGRVHLSGGEVFAAGTVIWAAGVSGSQMLRRLGLAEGDEPALRVRPDLRWVGDDSVYALGDIARPADESQGDWEPSAQAAVAHALHIARNLLAELAGRPTAAFRHKGEHHVLGLGPGRSVWVTPKGRLIGGRPAEWVKEFAALRHLYGIGGMRLVKDAWPQTIGSAFRRSEWDGPPLAEGDLLGTCAGGQA